MAEASTPASTLSWRTGASPSNSWRRGQSSQETRPASAGKASCSSSSSSSSRCPWSRQSTDKAAPRSSSWPASVPSSTTFVAGDIAYIPQYEEIVGRTCPDRNIPSSACGHPVVVLGVDRRAGTAKVMVTTSFGGKTLAERYLSGTSSADNKGRRNSGTYEQHVDEYLSLGDQAPHPRPGRPVIRLAEGKLRPSYVKISERWTVHLSDLATWGNAAKVQHRLDDKSLAEADSFWQSFQNGHRQATTPEGQQPAKEPGSCLSDFADRIGRARQARPLLQSGKTA